VAGAHAQELIYTIHLNQKAFADDIAPESL